MNVIGKIGGTIKWLLLLGAIGYGLIWAFGSLARMGETSGVSNGQTTIRSAEEIMRPTRKKSW